jgi:tyrosyl-tRNA synthetase
MISIVSLFVECNLLPSKSEARKMIQNGGIRINGTKVIDINLIVEVTNELILQVGKRRFVKLITN